MIKDSPNTQIDHKDPYFERVAGINEMGYDYKLLRNIPIIPDSSTSVKGLVTLSVPPVSSTNPIAVGNNDPRLTKNVSIGSVTFGIGQGSYTINAGFQPNLIRITATCGSNQSAFFQSVNINGLTTGLGFDFNTGFGTTAFSNFQSIDIRINGVSTTGTLSLTPTGGTLTFSSTGLANVYMQWEAIG